MVKTQKDQETTRRRLDSNGDHHHRENDVFNVNLYYDYKSGSLKVYCDLQGCVHCLITHREQYSVKDAKSSFLDFVKLYLSKHLLSYIHGQAVHSFYSVLAT